MKVNGKYVLVGSVLIALLLVAGSWKFFYSADQDETKKVQNQINSLQTRLNDLNAKNEKKTEYEQGIESSKDIIDTVLSLYGPGNTPEKTIMTVVKLCQMTGCSISSIAFQDNRVIYESASPEIKVYKSGMSINITCGYTALKKIVDFINSYSLNSHYERMNIENFSSKYNSETGLLSTSMTVNLYGVSDENHKYEPPVLEDIEIGNENIFKAPEYVPEEEPQLDENGQPIIPTLTEEQE